MTAENRGKAFHDAVAEALRDRYEGHGDLDLLGVELAVLKLTGFTRWGKGGWVRDEEGAGTCYDDRWAMREALHLAEEGR